MGMRTRFRPALPVMALLASAMVALPAPALAGGDRVIRVTTTIQAAVDAAMPGDTVLVPPGTYRESVLIDKSDLTLRGSRGAEIDAHGFQVRGGRYLDSHEYGVFPRCSTHGAIEGSLAEGANDFVFYVAAATE